MFINADYYSSILTIYDQTIINLTAYKILLWENPIKKGLPFGRQSFFFYSPGLSFLLFPGSLIEDDVHTGFILFDAVFIRPCDGRKAGGICLLHSASAAVSSLTQDDPVCAL